MADVFISYAREDRTAVEQLHGLLGAEQVSSWFDAEISAGERFAERTASELAAAKAVVVLWSRHSLHSDWVADEAGEARDTGRLAPVSLDGSIPPLGFRQFQCVDFSAWTGKRDRAFAELLAAIRKLTAGGGVPPAVAAAAPVRTQGRRFPKAALFGLAAIAVAAAIAAYVLFKPGPPETDRVVVFDFSGPAREPELVQLGGDIAADIAAQLTPSGIDVIARSEAGAQDSTARVPANFAIQGSISRKDGGIEAKAAVVAPGTGTVLWSQSLSEPAGPEAISNLRLRTARSTADALACALYARRFDGPPIAPESIALLLRVCGKQATPDSEIEQRDLMAQLVEREPQFAFGQAGFAVASAFASETAPKAMRDQLRAEGRAAANRAIELDPAVGDAYVALYLLEGRTAFTAQERWLAAGIRRDELNSTLFGHYGTFLTHVGRMEEGLAYYRRAAALDPLSIVKQSNVAWATFESGDRAEGRRQIDALAIARPKDKGVALTRARMALFAGQPDEALAAFEAYGSGPEQLACWKDAAAALESAGSRARADAANRVKICFDSGGLPPMTSLIVLAALGEVDLALEIARLRSAAGRLGYEALFSPLTAPMRDDVRFMELARDVGLLSYWRESGHWPDFCAAAAYDCKAEAARLAGQ